MGIKAEEGNVYDANLLKFIHWKLDVGRATERIRSFQKWRKVTPFAFDNPPLYASVDPQLKKLLEAEILVIPKDIYSKDGECRVVIGRLRNNKMSEHGSSPEDVARMMFYTIDRVLENEKAQTNGILLFHDLSGLSRANLHPKIPKILIPGLIGHFPVKIRGIYILNAPWFFKTMFKVISMILPAKLRARVHFVNDISLLHQVINKADLLEEHGGNVKHDQVR
uniref:CRAL-TRIO domain-containing protein n=1 Tax=Aplanochytrium stocchinoi TaxID=215587 RepID=A0A7S3LRN4_9STRA